MIELDFSGRSVLITGGASGIGLETSARAAEAGASVHIVDVSAARIDEARQHLAARGLEATGHAVDITDSGAVDSLFDEVRPESLVNCAGILVGGDVASTSDEDWRRQFAVNVDGLFYCSRAFVQRRLKDGLGGRIVSIASVGGLIGDPGYAAYCATKGTVVNLTRQMAVDYAGHGIQVNAVAPGFTQTAMTGIHDESTAASFTRLIPRGRWAQPREIADAVIFLLSDLSAHVHGHTLVVDGGRLAGTPH